MALSLKERREIIDEEEKRFKKVQEMIDKKEVKELENWLKRFAREERKELKSYNKKRKDDWL